MPQWRNRDDQICSKPKNLLSYMIDISTIQKKNEIFLRLIKNNLIETTKTNNTHFLPKKLQKIFEKFSDVFPDGLSLRRAIDHKIEFLLGSSLSCKAFYRLAYRELEKCKTQIEDMLSKEFNNPI